MRFQRIIEALYRQPLDITVGGFESIDAIVRPHLLGKSPMDIKDGQFVLGQTDLFGTPLPAMLEVDEETGLALVNINGPLLQHASLIDKSCGACSYQDIVQALNEAEENRYVRDILMVCDSPGGQHCGTVEAAERVAEIALNGEKEIFAFTDSTIASAMYELVAGCNGIFATRSSYVGCIGSLIAFLDVEKAYEMQGIKAVVFASGKYKGAGIDGTSLTQAQADYFQEMVDTSAGQFKEHVMQFRKQIAPESMEGQIFYGEDAEALGLVDELVSDLDEVEQFLAE
jgi:signal peptide peptidase SppA